jgi:hypothetical protein
MSEIKDFKDLIIWQKGMDIAQKRQEARVKRQKLRT